MPGRAFRSISAATARTRVVWSPWAGSLIAINTAESPSGESLMSQLSDRWQSLAKQKARRENRTGPAT
jgi:hypothetical protein